MSWLLFPLAAVHASPSLVANPSFEAGLADWIAYPWGDAEVAVDDAVARTGRTSARVRVSPEGADDYPSIKATLGRVTPGEMYEGRVFARGRGATDVGGYTVLEFMCGDDRIGMAQGPVTGPGDVEWTELVVRGIVPDGCDAVHFALVCHGAGTVWFDDASLVCTGKAPHAFDGDRLTLKLGHSRRAPFLGFGAQGDFQLSRPFNVARGVTEDDRELVRARVSAMRPHIIRTFLDYRWWEPEEGRQTPDSEAMRDYVGWVRLLESIGCAVLLNPWGDRFAYSEWMGPGEGRLPARPDAMVRSLVDCLEHLVRVERLTNIRYICLMNEPDNDPTRPVDVREYARLNRLLDSTLRDRGLRDGIALITADDSWGDPVGPSDWFSAVVAEGLEYADIVSTHTYRHEYVPALAPWIASRRELLRRSNPKRPRPLLITEFGHGGETYSNWENGKHEYGLFLADFAVTALSEGASGALMWCLFDTCYSESDEHWQKWGLWCYRDEGWRPRPGFYSWSLITRYTRPGSRVTALRATPDAPGVRAVMLVAPSGETTILIVNRYERELDVRLELGETIRVRLYEYSRASVPTEDEKMLRSLRRVTFDSGASIQLPPESFTVLTDVR